MAKHKSKKGGGTGFTKKRRSRNPFRRRHHKNPAALGYSSLMELFTALLSGAAGLIVDAYVPSLALASLNSNAALYVAEIALVALPAWLLSKYPTAAKAWVIGSGANVVGHIIDDVTGQQYISVNVNKGVSSFYMNGQQYVLPSPSVFKGLSPGGSRAMLTAAPAATTTFTPMSTPGALGAVRYPFAA